MSLDLTAKDHAAFAPIEEASGRFRADVEAWAHVNSGSAHYEGLDRMRAVVADRFGAVGADVEMVDMAPSIIIAPDGTETERHHPPAVKVTRRPSAPVQIAMTGHYDTVYPPDAGFNACTLLDEDTLNGPGVADMKGGLLALAAALEALERHPDKDRLGYTALISPDEEIGNPASAPHIATLGARAHVGMTYEPALETGELAGARKGSGNFTVVVHGRSAHAGREHAQGRNAIAAAAHAVTALQALNGQREGVTVNVGSIAGGGPLNRVPDLAIFGFNVRMVEMADMDWLTARIGEVIAMVNAKDGIAAKQHGGFTRPPKPMTPQNAQMFSWTKAAGGALGLDIRWTDTGGVCEGNNLWAAGCPNVDTLGVRGGRIHSAEEFVTLSSFAERAKLSAVMLFRFASGDFDAPALRAE